MDKRLILDIDGGPGNALALLLAAGMPGARLEAVCTVFGDEADAAATATAVKVLLAGVAPDTPVYTGCGAPLSRRLFAGDGALPKPQDEAGTLPWALMPGATAQGGAAPWPAALFYAGLCAVPGPPVTIVTAGALTNLAMALTVEPALTKHIDRVIVAGGGDLVTDRTGAAEAAIWRDPEAAQKLIHSGVKVLFVPLDAAVAAAPMAQALEALDKGSPAISNAVEQALAHCPRTPSGGVMLHAALAVCAMVRPQVLAQVQAVHCEIGYNDFSRGQTMIDRRRCELPPLNAEFAFSASRQALLEALEHLLRKEALHA